MAVGGKAHLKGCSRGLGALVPRSPDDVLRGAEEDGDQHGNQHDDGQELDEREAGAARRLPVGRLGG